MGIKPLKHGGARKNAGRKKKKKPDFDEEFKSDIIKVLSELGKEHKMPFLKKIFGMVYDDKVQDTVKASLFKTYVELFVTTNDPDINVTQVSGPGIYLPPINPDPAQEEFE